MSHGIRRWMADKAVASPYVRKLKTEGVRQCSLASWQMNQGITAQLSISNLWQLFSKKVYQIIRSGISGQWQNSPVCKFHESNCLLQQCVIKQIRHLGIQHVARLYHNKYNLMATSLLLDYINENRPHDAGVTYLHHAFSTRAVLCRLLRPPFFTGQN